MTILLHVISQSTDYRIFADRRSVDALKLGNHNEQYSRKHNIRMLNFPERKDENLREDFVKLVNTEVKFFQMEQMQDICKGSVGPLPLDGAN